MKISRLLFLIFVLIFWISTSSVSAHSYKDATQLPQYFGEEIFFAANDYIAYWTVPLRWKSKEWETLGVVAGTTAALILVDHTLFFGVDPENFKDFNRAISPIHALGDWRIPGVALPLVYAASLGLQDKKLERGTRIAWKSFLFQSLVNQGMKNIIYRYKRTDAYEFQIGPPKWELPSSGAFPSGHASNAWSVLSGYAIAYKDDPVIPPVCYTLATLSSLTLIPTRDHWVSDIFLGAALGYFSAELVASMDDERNGLSLQPSLSMTGLGLSVTQEFAL